MEPDLSEAVVRVAAFAIGFALLAALEALWPSRRRAVGRRRRWVSNLGLVVVGTILVRVTPFLSAVAVARLAEARSWGLLQAIGPMPIGIGIAASAVLLDLAIYLQHVLFHALPSLWRLHRVHHTDPELDVTTGVRFHPVEFLLSAGLKAAAVGVLGAPVAGVIVFEIVLNAGSLWSHANLRIPKAADRLLRLVVVTPDMHRVHHSIDSAEADSNFGFTLSWWDGLFGTYLARSRIESDRRPTTTHQLAEGERACERPFLLRWVPRSRSRFRTWRARTTRPRGARRSSCAAIRAARFRSWPRVYRLGSPPPPSGPIALPPSRRWPSPV